MVVLHYNKLSPFNNILDCTRHVLNVLTEYFENIIFITYFKKILPKNFFLYDS